MKDMLNAVDHRRPIGTFENVHDAFEPKDLIPAVFGERLEKQRQRNSLDRLIAHDRVGLYCVMACMRVTVGLLR